MCGRRVKLAKQLNSAFNHIYTLLIIIKSPLLCSNIHVCSFKFKVVEVLFGLIPYS